MMKDTYGTVVSKFYAQSRQVTREAIEAASPWKWRDAWMVVVAIVALLLIDRYVMKPLVKLRL